MIYKKAHSIKFFNSMHLFSFFLQIFGFPLYNTSVFIIMQTFRIIISMIIINQSFQVILAQSPQKATVFQEMSSYQRKISCGGVLLVVIHPFLLIFLVRCIFLLFYANSHPFVYNVSMFVTNQNFGVKTFNTTRPFLRSIVCFTASPCSRGSWTLGAL